MTRIWFVECAFDLPDSGVSRAVNQLRRLGFTRGLATLLRKAPRFARRAAWSLRDRRIPASAASRPEAARIRRVPVPRGDGSAVMRRRVLPQSFGRQFPRPHRASLVCSVVNAWGSDRRLWRGLASFQCRVALALGPPPSGRSLRCGAPRRGRACADGAASRRDTRCRRRAPCTSDGGRTGCPARSSP